MEENHKLGGIFGQALGFPEGVSGWPNYKSQDSNLPADHLRLAETFRDELHQDITNPFVEVLAVDQAQHDVSAAVSYTSDRVGLRSTIDAIPQLEIHHLDGCCCPGCGGMRHEDMIQITARLASGSGGGLGGEVVSAASQLSDMADFLTTGFWTEFGTVPRKFNLTDTGVNPKSGVLHYNVTGFSNAGSAGSDTYGISVARAELVRDVLDVFSEVLGITFVETTSSDTNYTDLFFKDTDASSAYSSSAGYSSGIQYSWINISEDWSGGTSNYNDYTLQTIFHEVGHSLGLGHQSLYNGSGAYPTDADFDNDSWQATMMSYFSQSENTTLSASFAFLQSPMAVDWIALQEIYGAQSFRGANFGIENAFIGNTVYGFNTNILSSTSEIWAKYAAYADVTASTIVDAGGVDTLDFSGFSATQLINLTPTDRFATAPSISNIGGLTGNLTLAEGTIIENAVGGSGADTFFGNDAANTFIGNGGNDIFNDSPGDDSYFGGSGVDTVDFLGLFSSYSFSFSGVFLTVMNVATDLVDNTMEFLSFDDQILSFQNIVDGLGSITPPVANDDAYSTDEGTVLTAASILANDTDADGDPLTVATVNGATANVGGQINLASGALITVNADGTFDYDPNGAFDGLKLGQRSIDSYTYTASDGGAASNTATVTIAINGVDDPLPIAPIGQSGVASIRQAGPDQWHSISFDTTIENAVVVLGPATRDGSNPLTTRVRNVTDNGFEFQIDEWEYLDGFHVTEDIGWLAISEGSHRLGTGQTIVASTASVGTGFSTLSFGERLTNPVVFAEVTTVNDPDAITTRIRNVTELGFQAQIEEEEAGGAHVGETASWIAIESGEASGLEVVRTDKQLSHVVDSFVFNQPFSEAPVLIADMQSAIGGDTSTVRLTSLDANGMSMFVEEERSADTEVGHINEVAGYVALHDGLIYAEAPLNPPPVANDDAYSTDEGAVLTAASILANDTDADGDPLTVATVNGATANVGGQINLASGALITVNADGTFDYDPNGAFDGLKLGQRSIDSYTYTASDGGAASNTATVTIAINGVDDPLPIAPIGQSGVASIRQAGPDQWHSISFDTTIENAVVVLGPATRDGSNPLTTRVRNVTDNGFEFQIDEWEYLDGFHVTEDIGWLAISEGSHRLGTGQTIVASTASVGTGFSTLSFGERLTNPVVFAEVTTVNDPDAITTRIRNVTELGFQAQIEEEEAGGAHVGETASWIAIESGEASGLEVVRTDKQLSHVVDSFVFNQPFSEAPVLIADMQSAIGGDTSTVRLTSLDANGMSMFVEEERSADTEVGHINEVAGYVALHDGLIYLDSFLI